LITTTESLKIPDVYSISLSGFSQEDSEQLLVSVCPQIDKFAATLSNLCQNLPLNLCLVAGYLKNSEIQVEDFISELEKHFEKFTDAEETSVERLLSYIVEHLSGKERNFLSQVAVVGEGFNKELVLELINLQNSGDAETIQTYLNTFTLMNFLSYDQGQGYYRMQTTVQDFVLKKLGPSSQVWYRLGKVFTTSADWYDALAKSGVYEVTPLPSETRSSWIFMT
jgi:hypothetical protein